MSNQPAVKKATLTPKGGQPFEVHFNPVSLEHNVALNMDNQQYVGTGTAKVTMELIFDTTLTGEDVRVYSGKVERLLVPVTDAAAPNDAAKSAPPLVKFEWGVFSFEGVLDAFKQTLDFWSASGVPLRAVVGVALTQPKYVFPPLAQGGAAPPSPLALPGGSPFAAAAAGGAPDAARAIALASGRESLRLEVGGALNVGAEVSIGAAAGVVSGGASFGAGIDVTAGVGGSLSAGVSASAGAFGALHTTGKVEVQVSPARFLSASAPPPLPAGAEFDVSGRATIAGGASFRADVAGRVQFDD
jgi:hypothetical protein